MRIHIASRFNGPPESGNGGYSCGLIARTIGQPVRVRLQQPVPLNQDLVIEPGAAGQWEVHAGSELIATAAIHEVKAEVPQAPSWVEAFGASQHYAGFAAHNFPSCFTCGPARVQGDGLRIFAGAVPGTNLLAAPWRPDASLADADGRLPPEFVWSSLDCPGFWATCSASVALLGELAVDVAHVPRIDEPCVIIAWRIGGDGRKHYAGTALFDSSGERCAVGVATWIELRS